MSVQYVIHYGWQLKMLFSVATSIPYFNKTPSWQTGEKMYFLKDKRASITNCSQNALLTDDLKKIKFDIMM